MFLTWRLLLLLAACFIVLLSALRGLHRGAGHWAAGRHGAAASGHRTMALYLYT